MEIPSKARQKSFSLELPQNRRRHDHGRDTRPANHYGIDEVVEDGADDPSVRLPSDMQSHIQLGPALAKPQLPRRFSGVPDPRSPPTVVESGIVHDLAHLNCLPIPSVQGSDARLVATIFYRGRRNDAGQRQEHSATVASSGATTDGNSGRNVKNTGREVVPASLAFGDVACTFPLELPLQEPEPARDGLYGACVSPICVAAFLHLMSTFPHLHMAEQESFKNDGPVTSTVYSTGYGSDLQASHRYLDRAVDPHVVEVVLGPAPALAITDLRRHEQLYRFEREWNVEVVLQPDSLWRRHPRLVVFDMDSTLITQEVIDMLAEAVTPDVAARVADITHRAMAGQLAFEEAFRERVRLLTGLPATFFDDLRRRLQVTNGVPELLRALRRLGVKTAVLSGGFQPLTGWLAGQLGIDHAHANQVATDDGGRLTGDVIGTIVGRERKCELLKQIAAEERIDLRQVVAVGDGANDLLMLEAAALGVAWHAKPVVQLEADARLNGTSLLELLFLFGFTQAEITELVAAK